MTATEAAEPLGSLPDPTGVVALDEAPVPQHASGADSRSCTISGRTVRRGVLSFRRTSPESTDEQLIERVRRGDRGAFGELYERHHREARAAARRTLRSATDADDVVSDAFAGVLNALSNGRGPRDNFRIYLLACVRNGCRRRRFTVVAGVDRDREADPRQSVVFEDPDRYVEADTVARAFASLTPRWQETLWLTDVQQWQAAEVGNHLRLTPNATAVLTRRARQAFAVAYLDQHVASATSNECAGFAARLGGYVRDQLTDAQRAAVARHLVICASCAKATDELRDLNTSLRSLAPAAATAAGAGSANAITTGVTSGWGTTALTGLFGGGVLVKGAAVLLIVSPLVFASDVNGQGRAEASVAAVEIAAAGTVPTDGVPAAPLPTRPTSVAATSAAVATIPSVAAPFTSATVPGAAPTNEVSTLDPLTVIDAVQERARHLAAEVIGSGLYEIIVNTGDVAQTTASQLDDVLKAGIDAVRQNVAVLTSNLRIDPDGVTIPTITVRSTSPLQVPATTVGPHIGQERPPAPATPNPAPTPIPTSPVTVPAVLIPHVTVPPVIVPVTLPPVALPQVTVPIVTVLVVIGDN